MRGGSHLAVDDLDYDPYDDFSAEDAEEEFELTCPGCEYVLSGNSFYEDFRVCPECRRHFWLPARERVGIIADHGSFRETNSEVVSIEPLVFRDAWPASDRSAAHLPADETVVTGKVNIGGREAVLVVVDMAMTPGSIGIVTGERICLAFEEAATHRVPVVAVCSGGVQTDRESLLTFTQKVRIASEVGRLQRNGVPFISVLTHPTTGAFFTGLGNHANIIFAEPAAQIGLGAGRARGPIDLGTGSSEEMLDAGMIDEIVERTALRERLVSTLDVLASRGVPRSSATPVWTAVPRGRGSDDSTLARHPSRPSSADFIDLMRVGLIEIRGDRTGTTDPNLIAGIGQIEGVTVGLIGSKRAPISAEGFRTIVRLFRLAGQLEIPVVSLIDSPGLPEADAVEGAALSNAIAQAMRVAVSLPIPTVAVVTGVAAGPGAMSLTVADRVFMFEHAVYATSGLDRPTPPGIAPAAQAGFWGGRECLRLGIVDGVIPEPAGGAHEDPQAASQQLRLTIVHALAELTGMGQRRLLDERSRKLRHLGLATPAGREALHLEIAQLHEIQQSLGRSIDELRGRLELYQIGLPTLPSLPQRPNIAQLPPLPHVDLSGLPTRPSLPAMRRTVKSRADMSNLAERFAATRRGLSGKGPETRGPVDTDDSLASKEPGADA